MSREVIAIIIVGVFFLALALSSPISRRIVKKRGQKFLTEHQNAVKIYSAKLQYKKMAYQLHKSFNGMYSRFIDEKGEGILLLPEEPYSIRLQCMYSEGNKRITLSQNLGDFVPAAGKTYVASCDTDIKVFSLEEGMPE